jgi:hypothetical protein
VQCNNMGKLAKGDPMKCQCDYLREEVKRLRQEGAKLECVTFPALQKAEKERDLWKSKAEALAEAIRKGTAVHVSHANKMTSCQTCGCDPELPVGREEMNEHDHRTDTCETCKSIDDYCKAQYKGYENHIAKLIEAGQKLVGKGYSILDGSDTLKNWREISGTAKGSS